MKKITFIIMEALINHWWCLVEVESGRLFLCSCPLNHYWFPPLLTFTSPLRFHPITTFSSLHPITRQLPHSLLSFSATPPTPLLPPQPSTCFHRMTTSQLKASFPSNHSKHPEDVSSPQKEHLIHHAASSGWCTSCWGSKRQNLFFSAL